MKWKWFLNGLFMSYRCEKTFDDIVYEFRVDFKPHVLRWFLTVSDKDNPNLILINEGPFSSKELACKRGESITEVIPNEN